MITYLSGQLASSPSPASLAFEVATITTTERAGLPLADRIAQAEAELERCEPHYRHSFASMSALPEERAHYHRMAVQGALMTIGKERCSRPNANALPASSRPADRSDLAALTSASSWPSCSSAGGRYCPNALASGEGISPATAVPDTSDGANARCRVSGNIDLRGW